MQLLGGHSSTISLPRHRDHRGALVPFDFAELPFLPRRAFVVGDVPAGARRGGHAHRSARQLLVRLTGTIAVELRHEGEEVTVQLEASDRGLLLEPGVWSRQLYGEDATLLVFSDEPYDAHSYLSE